MIVLFSLLGLGFLLGMRHATDPDHVIAVSTIVSRQRSLWRATGVGALWGVGHTMTLLAAGGTIILLRLSVTPRFGLGLEFIVALMLIVLGLMNLAGRRAVNASQGSSAARPLLIGGVHGLAGTGALVLAVGANLGPPELAMLYLLTFGVGTIAGMVLVTAMISLPSLFVATRFEQAGPMLRTLSGAASVTFGVWLAYQAGVVDGLFSSVPRWEPH